MQWRMVTPTTLTKNKLNKIMVINSASNCSLNKPEASRGGFHPHTLSQHSVFGKLVKAISQPSTTMAKREVAPWARASSADLNRGGGISPGLISWKNIGRIKEF